MQVETFECQEVVEQTPEVTEEAQILITKLGLIGQDTFYRSKTEDGPGMCPYRLMTREEQAVYRALCPRTVDLQKYESGPIPMRILQVAAHATELNLGKLSVWCPQDAHDPDPILVAQGETNKPPFLL